MAQSGEGTAALEKALDVFEAVSKATGGISQADLSDQLKVPRTTLYRLLSTLVARGLVRRDPVRRVYCLGFKCFELARSAHASPDLVSAAAFEMRALRDLSGETTYLAILDGTEVLALERFDGAHSERSSASLGERKPVHCTSQGKAILAAMPEAARDALLRDISLKPRTPRTITEKRRLMADLRLIAQRGFSIDDEEIVEGVRCVGAAVIDSAGRVRGAISIAGPAWRMTLPRLDTLGIEVAEAAARIGEQLALVNNAASGGTVSVIDCAWAFEGRFPVWIHSRQELLWADRMAPTIHQYRDKADRELLTLESPIEGMCLFSESRLLVLHERELLIVSLAQEAPVIESRTPIPCERITAMIRENEGRCWVCYSDDGRIFQVGLWDIETNRIKPHWQVGDALNSLAWNSANQSLHGVSTATGVILMMHLGRPQMRRLTTVPKGSGKPHGLAVDAEGGVWTTLQEGWGVVRYSNDGTLDRVISLPVSHPSDLCFCEPSLGQSPNLFITTARLPVSVDTLAKAPASGQLLMVDTSG
jgi:IclR family transcriptional regulator, acetate operon repressor